MSALPSPVNFNNDNNDNQDGFMPRVNFNLAGGGAIDYNDGLFLGLINYFFKYQFIDNSEIVEVYLKCGKNSKLAKKQIMEKYNIQEEKLDILDIEEFEFDEDESDSDDEFTIPADAVIISLDEYEEPEIVELVKIKKEPGTESRKRKFQPTDEPPMKFIKVSDSLDDWNNKKAFRGIAWLEDQKPVLKDSDYIKLMQLLEQYKKIQ